VKKNPLSKVIRHVKVKGTINNSTVGIDVFGNPVIGKTEIVFEVVVFDLEGNNKTGVNYRGKYGIDPSKKIVKVYLDKYISGNAFDLTKINPIFNTLDNTTTFTVIDKNQSNLVPITKVFGNYLVCVMEGSI
jgi:hypothetical protein